MPVSGMKARSPAVVSNHSAFHRRSAQSAALLLLSDELMRNECLNLRRRAFALDGQVSAEWSRCPERQWGTIATKLSRLDACEDKKVVRW